MAIDFVPVPGKWYVSLPSCEYPRKPPAGGPFDTEEQARLWAGCLPFRGGIVWQGSDSDDVWVASRKPRATDPPNP
jgi:hypothetical protein